MVRVVDSISILSEVPPMAGVVASVAAIEVGIAVVKKKLALKFL
jgi:hypothetical protein